MASKDASKQTNTTSSSTTSNNSTASNSISNPSTPSTVWYKIIIDSVSNNSQWETIFTLKNVGDTAVTIDGTRYRLETQYWWGYGLQGELGDNLNAKYSTLDYIWEIKAGQTVTVKYKEKWASRGRENNALEAKGYRVTDLYNHKWEYGLYVKDTQDPNGWWFSFNYFDFISLPAGITYKNTELYPNYLPPEYDTSTKWNRSGPKSSEFNDAYVSISLLTSNQEIGAMLHTSKYDYAERMPDGVPHKIALTLLSSKTLTTQGRLYFSDYEYVEMSNDFDKVTVPAPIGIPADSKFPVGGTFVVPSNIPNKKYWRICVAYVVDITQHRGEVCFPQWFYIFKQS